SSPPSPGCLLPSAKKTNRPKGRERKRCHARRVPKKDRAPCARESSRQIGGFVRVFEKTQQQRAYEYMYERCGRALATGRTQGGKLTGAALCLKKTYEPEEILGTH
ncbi:unnamed protein product, partial [Ectocarpus sp. 4 AP-2014]